MNRLYAALIHLAVSAIVAGVIVLLMLFAWYPPPFFTAMGGATLILLLVGVDVILGPLVTLLIFDLKKKSLRFDILCIAILQAAALAYGASIMFQSRPVYVVYFKDRFDVVTSSRIPKEELMRAKGMAYESLPLGGPQTVALNLPIDPEEKNRMLFHRKASGDFVAFPQHYVSYERRSKDAANAAKPIAQLRTANPHIQTELFKLLAAKAIDEKDIGYLPMVTFSSEMAVVLRRDTGEILGMLFANPW
jgi:hypothetical protein